MKFVYGRCNNWLTGTHWKRCVCSIIFDMLINFWMSHRRCTATSEKIRRRRCYVQRFLMFSAYCSVALSRKKGDANKMKWAMECKLTIWLFDNSEQSRSLLFDAPSTDKFKFSPSVMEHPRISFRISSLFNLDESLL